MKDSPLVKGNVKTVIAVWNAGQKGKTESVRAFANSLLASFPSAIAIEPVPATIPSSGDFRLVVNIQGVIVGIESQGDPKTRLNERLEELAVNKKYQCDIIICTCRTRGETVWAVETIGNNHGFEIIWTSTYQIGDPRLHTLVNNAKGNHILELLLQLSLL